jgi:hypothetical protein
MFREKKKIPVVPDSYCIIFGGRSGVANFIAKKILIY